MRDKTCYMTGFGNDFASEAVRGALPIGQNSPQKVPFGLYAEQLSGTAFTAPRHTNLRTWLYRLRPSASHAPFTPYKNNPLLRSAPLGTSNPDPNRLRWSPLPLPQEPTDFVDGLVTFAANGDVSAQLGLAIHLFAANRSMHDRVIFNADGDLLIVPQSGRLTLFTELGVLKIEPLQIAVIPRGLRFRVALPDGKAFGYVCETYGQPFKLPDLGPIGANGLANTRDFEYPVAAYEDLDGPCELIQKYQGKLWSTHLNHSPLDVVAWHGNLAPYRYDLTRFMVINTVSYDHPDPSIFTVLSSPSDTPGTSNIDFVIFPPRWMVAEHTFRPPWFHRNIMSEFMGLIDGSYDAKAEGFTPGGASLHTCMNAHGPDRVSYEAALSSDLTPVRLDKTMAFMFESRLPLTPTDFALKTSLRQPDYDQCWDDFKKAMLPQ